MIISKLDYNKYKGQKYQAEILSDRYLSIEPDGEGFDIRWVMSDEPLRMSINDTMLSDWLDHPTAYGAFEGDRLVGFVEGFLEKWNNRYRISNICVFDHADRRNGVGMKLMEAILAEAFRSGARMAVLETQSFNFKAVSSSSDLTDTPTQTTGPKSITCGSKWAGNCRIESGWQHLSQSLLT